MPLGSPRPSHTNPVLVLLSVILTVLRRWLLARMFSYSLTVACLSLCCRSIIISPSIGWAANRPIDPPLRVCWHSTAGLVGAKFCQLKSFKEVKLRRRYGFDLSQPVMGDRSTVTGHAGATLPPSRLADASLLRKEAENCRVDRQSLPNVTAKLPLDPQRPLLPVSTHRDKI